MGDFDFEELDKAVTNVLGDKTARKEASLMAGDTTLAPKTLPTDRPFSSGSFSAGGTTAAQPLVKPRSSINRGSQSSPANRGVIDIMAPPSKQASHQSAGVAPTSIDGIRPAKSGVSTKVNQPSVASTGDKDSVVSNKASGEDPGLRWPPKHPAALTNQPTTDIDAPKEDPPATSDAIAPDNEDSFERFDALSRSGFDFDEPSEPEDTLDVGKNQEVEKQEQRTTGDEPSSVEASADRAADEIETERVLTSIASKSDDTPEEYPIVASQQSPFLSNTKVEKRPLGSYSGLGAPEAVDGIEQLTINDTPASAETPAEPTETNPEPVAVAGQDAAATRVAPDHLLTDGHEHEQVTVRTASSGTTPAPASAMTSIPQQYKIAAEEGDDTPRPVFDTTEYHAPINDQDVKTHRGTGFLIASIVLLVLAVAAAAGIYFYGGQLGL